MRHVIVVAGGDSARRLRLLNQFDSARYKVSLCLSTPDFIRAVNEEKVIAILLLCPDESGVMNDLFVNDRIDQVIDRCLTVLISSSSAENAHVRSLNYRADEFLIEPISFGEVIALIENRVVEDRKLLEIGDLVLDRTSLTVTLRNVELPLQPVQVRVLEFLMLRYGRACTRSELSNGIWSADCPVDDRTIDVSVGRIRDAIKHKVTVDPIRTVRGVGYAFNEYFERISSLPKKGRGIGRPQRLRARRVAD